MAEKTLGEEELSREDAAARLRALADEIEGEGEADVQVNNKTVTVHPSAAIAYEIGVRESTSILRGNRETVTVKMGWRPE